MKKTILKKWSESAQICFLHYCQPTQNQPNSHFLFHRNVSLCNFYIMTLCHKGLLSFPPLGFEGKFTCNLGPKLVVQEENSKFWVPWPRIAQFVYFLKEVCVFDMYMTLVEKFHVWMSKKNIIMKLSFKNWKKFPQKIYKLTNSRSWDSEFRIFFLNHKFWA
jgi:hypothetical protein